MLIIILYELTARRLHALHENAIRIIVEKHREGARLTINSIVSVLGKHFPITEIMFDYTCAVLLPMRLRCVCVCFWFWWLMREEQKRRTAIKEEDQHITRHRTLQNKRTTHDKAKNLMKFNFIVSLILCWTRKWTNTLTSQQAKCG